MEIYLVKRYSPRFIGSRLSDM